MMDGINTCLAHLWLGVTVVNVLQTVQIVIIIVVVINAVQVMDLILHHSVELVSQIA